VVVVLLVATIVTSTVIDRIAEQQDRRLLEGRTGEVAVFLESSMGEIERTFPFLEGVVRLAADPVQGFQLAAGTIVGGTIAGVGMTEQVDGAYEATALVGEGPAAGTPMGEEWLTLLARATSEDDVVTHVLPATGEETRVGFAYASEGLPTVFFMELRFDPPNVFEQTPGSPFSDIAGNVYVGTDADRAHLVVTTARGPLTGHVVRDSITVGADEWLVLTTTTDPLVGPLAEQTRWGVLIGGIVLALLTGTLVEILSRRRAYALRLVEERTTELQGARQVAEDANRSKSVFLSRMSHELRTPLNAVLGFGQVLESESLEPRQRESVEHIVKGGRHLLDLINEVLDISRIEAGELSLSPEAVHVSDLVNDAVDTMRPMAAKRGIQLLFDRTGACDCYAFADRQRSKQVLLNLLANAVKYNRPNGSVAVSCEQPADGPVTISVTDTGPGIPAERIPLLFTAFERLGAEHSGIEGTGIGLALSQRLAEAMGGRISVDSTLGTGSTFSVDLPRAEGPVERYERMHRPTDSREATPPGRLAPVVLHIEDNLANLKLIERILDDRDVEIVPAMQGRLGLELAREHHPALVLLDLHLADMDGEQVLHRLRDDPATEHIPVVIVSADATQGTVQRLLTAGATAFITKPIDIHQLHTVLDEALAQHRGASARE
jgi:signal transduction histidine kinase/ActR/RegA family two-component response regulator